MKFVFFSVSENGENGLGDEGADGAMPTPRIFGLEPPPCIGEPRGTLQKVWNDLRQKPEVRAVQNFDKRLQS